MAIVRDPVQTLHRIEAWMARNHPDRLPLFRPGVDSGALHRIEAKLGQPMPGDLRLLYAAHDGQPEGAPTLYLNQRWLPLDLMAVAWEDLCRRYGGHDAPAAPAATAAGPVEATFWSAAWLPLFGSSRGDHYCVDLRPDRTGGHGRIIWFLYDLPERAVIAHSVSHMLARVADGLETGRWRLDEDFDGLSD